RCLRQQFAVDVPQGHGCTGLEEPFRDGAAESFGAASDDGTPTAQIDVVHPRASLTKTLSRFFGSGREDLDCRIDVAHRGEYQALASRTGEVVMHPGQPGPRQRLSKTRDERVAGRLMLETCDQAAPLAVARHGMSIVCVDEHVGRVHAFERLQVWDV